MYLYQKDSRYFAQVLDNVESIAAEEIEELGGTNIQTKYRGVSFDATPDALYKITYSAKIPTRIVAPIINFDCHSTKYLYKTAYNIRWEDFLTLKKTFAIFSSVSNSLITHSQYASLCLKDAIVDYFREKYNDRPNIDPKSPDVWLNLYINDNKATISLELTGGSLHRRGYKTNPTEAPMMENLAAAIIRITKWDGSQPLYDPMCGSGTLLAEALLNYCKIPSCYAREKIGLFNLPGFDHKLFDKIKKEISQNTRTLPDGLIGGSDISDYAIKNARANFKNLPGGNKVSLKVSDFRKLDNLENYLIITNPPYGKRLGDEKSVGILMKEFGDFLKNSCKNSNAFVYFGNREMIKKIGLKTSMKLPLKNGGLDGRLTHFKLY